MLAGRAFTIAAIIDVLLGLGIAPIHAPKALEDRWTNGGAVRGGRRVTITAAAWNRFGGREIRPTRVVVHGDDDGNGVKKFDLAVRRRLVDDGFLLSSLGIGAAIPELVVVALGGLQGS